MRAAPARVAKPAAPKSAGSDFEKWYIENLGTQYTGQDFLTKPEDMDAATWAVGQTLYNLYNTNKQTDTALANQTAQINAQQDYATQQAAIMNEKLQKYLKMAYAAQGAQIPGGDLIAAQNNYVNQLGQIGSEYAGLKTQAEQQAAATKQTAQSAAQQGLATIYGQQAERAAQTEGAESEQTAYIQQLIGTRVASKLDEMFGQFEVNEETGKISWEDYQTMAEYYEQNKDRLDKATQEYLEYLLESEYEHDPEPKEVETKEQDGVVGLQVGDWTIKNNNGVQANESEAHKNGDHVAQYGVDWVYYNGFWYPANKA